MPSPALCPRCQTTPKGPSGFCRPCRNEYRRQYYRDNHDKAKRQVRLAAWKRQGINITWNQYQQLITAQNNLCAICHQPSQDGRALHVDHNHHTGQVRALLCHHCNTALGKAHENPDLLRSMANYLEQHQPKTEGLTLYDKALVLA